MRPVHITSCNERVLTCKIRSQGLFRRIITCMISLPYALALRSSHLILFPDGGLSAFVNMFILWLLLRQVALSRSAAGLSRVSRYPFIIQSMIDALSFIGVSALHLQFILPLLISFSCSTSQSQFYLRDERRSLC